MSDLLEATLRAIASLDRCVICKAPGQIGTQLEVSRKTHRGGWLHYHLLCLDGHDPWRGEAA